MDLSEIMDLESLNLVSSFGVNALEFIRHDIKWSADGLDILWGCAEKSLVTTEYGLFASSITTLYNFYKSIIQFDQRGLSGGNLV